MTEITAQQLEAARVRLSSLGVNLAFVSDTDLTEIARNIPRSVSQFEQQREAIERSAAQRNERRQQAELEYLRQLASAPDPDTFELERQARRIGVSPENYRIAVEARRQQARDTLAQLERQMV